MSDKVYKIKNKVQLEKRGVPLDIIGMEPFSILESLGEFKITLQGKVKYIRASNQFEVFKKTYKGCNATKRRLDSWKYFITGKTDAKKARYVAALLMDAYATHCYRMQENGEECRLPYWHCCYGFKDKLLDKELQSRIGIPGLLVIDCLYNDTTAGKLDKIRDLLNMFSNIPTILIGVGFDPVEMSRKNLYIMPNKMLHFEDSFETLNI